MNGGIINSITKVASFWLFLLSHTTMDGSMNVKSVVSVVCCQVEVSATSLSLVQRSPTNCGASLCVI
jgi:hypothetical protein